MDVRTFRGANKDSDHYLLKSKIRSWISNARKMYGSYARKFNTEKLKSPETSPAHREKLNEYLARRVDNDDINEVWMLLKKRNHADSWHNIEQNRKSNIQRLV